MPNARYTVDHLYEDQGDGKNNLRSLSLWQFGVIRALGRTGIAVSVVGTAFLLAVVVWSFRRLRPLVREVIEVDRWEPGPPTAHLNHSTRSAEEPEDPARPT
jgi:hypothetical protein